MTGSATPHHAAALADAVRRNLTVPGSVPPAEQFHLMLADRHAHDRSAPGSIEPTYIQQARNTAPDEPAPGCLVAAPEEGRSFRVHSVGSDDSKIGRSTRATTLTEPHPPRQRAEQHEPAAHCHRGHRLRITPEHGQPAAGQQRTDEAGTGKSAAADRHTPRVAPNDPGLGRGTADRGY
jgi:hypothetical protein